MVVICALSALGAEPEVVVVEAPKRSLESSQIASVTVLEVDESVPESEDLAGLVGTATGVTVQRLGGLGDLATIRIRGSSARQVEVFLDGVPLNPNGGAGVDLSELPVRSFERVELYRGNAPLRLGGQAMGGAMNLVSGEGEATRYSFMLGSWRTARIRALVRRKLPAGDVFVGGSVLSKRGNFRYFYDPGTPFNRSDDRVETRRNNDLRLGTVNARWRLNNGPTRFTLFNSFLAREQGVPGFTANPNTAVRLQVVRDLAVAQVAIQGRTPLELRVDAQHRYQRLSDPLEELGRIQGSAENRTTSVGLWGRGIVSGTMWTLEAVGSLRYDHVAGAAGGQRLVGTAQLGSTVIMGPFTVVPVVSTLGVASSGAGQAQTLLFLPRLGASLQLHKSWLIKGNIGRYARMPDLLELFGDQGYMKGSPTLRGELGFSADLALRAESAWGSLEAGGFLTESENLITYVQNAQQVAVPTNLGRAEILGGEAAVTLTPWTWLRSTTNLTVQRPLNLTEGYRNRQLPRQPIVRLDERIGLTARGVHLGYSFSYVDGVFTDPVNSRIQPPRPFHNVDLRYTHHTGFSVGLDLQNLFDTQRQVVQLDPTGDPSLVAEQPIVDFVGYPLPGRSIWVSVGFEVPEEEKIP